MEGEKKMMLVRKYGRVMMLSPEFFLFVFGELSIMKKRPESMMLVEIWVLESKMLKHHDAYKKLVYVVKEVLPARNQIYKMK